MKKMKKQDANLTIQKALKEVKRHFDVVVDDLKDEIKIIAEQHGDIKKTLDSHTEMIGSMKEDIEVMKSDITTTKTDVEIIKSDIEFIKGPLKKKVDYDEFAALERRMSLLEAKVRR